MASDGLRSNGGLGLLPSPAGAWPCIASVLAAYVLLCALLRYRQKRAIEARFHSAIVANNLSLLQAYEIQKWLSEQEFPATFSASIFFALFKVWHMARFSPPPQPVLTEQAHRPTASLPSHGY